MTNPQLVDNLSGGEVAANIIFEKDGRVEVKDSEYGVGQYW